MPATSIVIGRFAGRPAQRSGRSIKRRLVAPMIVTGWEIGTLTARIDRGGVTPSANNARVRGDVRNQRRSFFIVISSMTRSRAALFPRRECRHRTVRPRVLGTSTPASYITRASSSEE
jgi:hypothetical protein